DGVGRRAGRGRLRGRVRGDPARGSGPASRHSRARAARARPARPRRSHLAPAERPSEARPVVTAARPVVVGALMFTCLPARNRAGLAAIVVLGVVFGAAPARPTPGESGYHLVNTIHLEGTGGFRPGPPPPGAP